MSICPSMHLMMKMMMTILTRTRIPKKSQRGLVLHPVLQAPVPIRDQGQDPDLDHALVEGLGRATPDLGPGNRVNR